MSVSVLYEDEYKPWVNLRVNELKVDGPLTVGGQLIGNQLSFNPIIQAVGGNPGGFSVANNIRQGGGYRVNKAIHFWARVQCNVTGATGAEQMQMSVIQPGSAGGPVPTIVNAMVYCSVPGVVNYSQYGIKQPSSQNVDLFRNSDAGAVQQPILFPAGASTWDVYVWGTYLTA